MDLNEMSEYLSKASNTTKDTSCEIGENFKNIAKRYKKLNMDIDEIFKLPNTEGNTILREEICKAYKNVYGISENQGVNICEVKNWVKNDVNSGKDILNQITINWENTNVIEYSNSYIENDCNCSSYLDGICLLKCKSCNGCT